MADDFDFDSAYQSWSLNLDREKKSGAARKSFANACIALREHPDVKGKIGFDEFAGCTYVLGALPWDDRRNRPWSQHDDLAGTEWLQRIPAPDSIGVSTTVTREAVERVAYENRFHPVLEWLEGLKWDGTERLRKWLTTCLGVPSTPLSDAIGRAFLISAVARIQRPGCKVDHMLILEGSQGLLKSTALRTLVGNDDWIADQIADLGCKDSFQDLAGVWIVELSELSAIRPGEVEKVKGYISRQVDHYRPSYGRRSIDVPRQCAFIGTTNAREYLSDSTGNRRYWPVVCGILDIEGIARDRDQLWAEAVAAYHAGERWWLTDDQLKRMVAEEQEARRIRHPWESIIADWLENPSKAPDREGLRAPLVLEDGHVTTAQILEHAIAKPVERQTTADMMAVGKILAKLGWKKRKAGKANRVVWERDTSEPGESEVSRQGVSPEAQGQCGLRNGETPTDTCTTHTHENGNTHKNQNAFEVSPGVSPGRQDLDDWPPDADWGGTL